MYTNEEKESTCVYDYIDDEWNIYSCVPKHITKLRKTAGVPYWVEETMNDNGETRIVAAKWKVKGNQVRFASPITSRVTEAQRVAATENMRHLQAQQRVGQAAQV
jgi:thiamine pyrophosphokinase